MFFNRSIATSKAKISFKGTDTKAKKKVTLMVCKKVPSAVSIFKVIKTSKNRRGRILYPAKGIIKGNAHGNDHKEEKAQGEGKSKHDACCIFPVKQAANGFHVKPPVWDVP